MQPFDYYKPESFEEAFEILTMPGKTVYPFAGATDLIPGVRDGVFTPDAVVDIKGLPGMQDLELRQVTSHTEGTPTGEYLFIGAATTMADIAASELVRTHCEVLAKAAYAMGNEQVRHRATLGGNICTASPAADSAPPLYVMEALTLIRGPEGERSVPVNQVFTGPKRNCLTSGEIITGVLIPLLPQDTIGYHEKLARRKAGDLAIVNVAALAIPNNGATTWRIALGAVGPTPVRSYESEAILAQGFDDAAVDRAAAAAYGCAHPITDVRSGRAYRQAMIVNLTQRAIRSIRDRLSERLSKE